MQGTRRRNPRPTQAEDRDIHARLHLEQAPSTALAPQGIARRRVVKERRHRKLLLHRKQIDKLIGAVQRDGQTIIPVKLYLNEAGKAKIEIALAKGKKLHDKREATAQRDWQRDKARLMKERG